MDQGEIFAEIILPLALGQTYTYRIPENLKKEIQPGKRVIVQFGKRKLYTGIIHSVREDKPSFSRIKEILTVLDDKPVVNTIQLSFWEWMADYYMCSLGEIFKAALPQGLKLESESRVIAGDDFDELISGSEEEYLFAYLKKQQGVSIQKLQNASGINSLYKNLQSLIDKNAVFIEERIKQKYIPLNRKLLYLTPAALQLTEKGEIQSLLKNSPRQKELMEYLFRQPGIKESGIDQQKILKEFNTGVVNSLLHKKLLERKTIKILRSQVYNGKRREALKLNSLQTKVLDKIEEQFMKKDVVLLHGVTSSGKTEIYIELIQKTISEGKQVLYLLPEIALTSQIVQRLQKVFGNKTGVFHSKFSDSERVDIYRRQQEGEEREYKLILGVRSAVFLPFRNLGLVIIDEEHENTFKQFDPAPRYHARDAAIVLAGYFSAKVLLGTATPSLESYTNAKSGKYGFAEMKERFGGILMPEINIADLRKARLKKQMHSVFTPVLLNKMQETLEKGKQVILFQNRRGYSSYFECEVCGDIPRCRSCDVSLTYHKSEHRLVCHYCGYSERPPANCRSCKSTRIINRGFGTELVEDDLELLFPGVKVARLDLDTTRSRRSYEKILGAFGAGETNILVGTQMLSKGLDFDNVALVGILNADQMLNYPDFRAYERSFQLMMQVSGRAGRKLERGQVIIQSSDPSHPVIRNVVQNDYLGFIKAQVEERQIFNYPPFVRMIRITLKSATRDNAQKAAVILGKKLKSLFGSRVLGPQEPVVGRIKNQYLQHINLKIEKSASFKKARELLRISLVENTNADEFKRVRINIDVDPY